MYNTYGHLCDFNECPECMIMIFMKRTTNQTQHNRKQTPIKSKVCVPCLLWVCVGSAMADSELTPGLPRADPERT